MSAPIELIVATYINGLEANRAMNELREMHNKNEIHLIDAGVMVKDKNGKTSITEMYDPRKAQGRNIGAVVGGLLGLLLGPKGSIAGAAIGAGLGAATGAFTGGITAEIVDSGIENKYLQTVVNKLEPTSSALMILVEDDWADKVLQVVDAYEADVDMFTVQLSIGDKIKNEEHPKRKSKD